jgi:hypothetical protein
MKLSFSLEHTNRAGIVRGLIWNTLEHGYRPVTVLHDVAEGTDVDVLDWFTENYPNVRYVRLHDGTLDEPDCLTVFEAAEAALGQ